MKHCTGIYQNKYINCQAEPFCDSTEQLLKFEKLEMYFNHMQVSCTVTSFWRNSPQVRSRSVNSINSYWIGIQVMNWIKWQEIVIFTKIEKQCNRNSKKIINIRSSSKGKGKQLHKSNEAFNRWRNGRYAVRWNIVIVIVSQISRTKSEANIRKMTLFEKYSIDLLFQSKHSLDVGVLSNEAFAKWRYVNSLDHAVREVFAIESSSCLMAHCQK